MSDTYDVIVIGSGFGGAITACRLAESGARTLVLERGRRWDTTNYPRSPSDPWLFDHRRPEKQSGWLDLRFFPRMTVAQGAGVGGGSLCYSSVVMRANAERFESGWPEEINLESLEPFYERVGTTMNVSPIPDGQRTKRHLLLENAGRSLGHSDRFMSVPLALTFDPDYSYDLPDPLSHSHSKAHDNAQGVRQGTCVHLGNCDIGCDVRAKNTLDLNYIPWAEKHGADVRPLHLVRTIEPDGTGYVVHFDRVTPDGLTPGRERAERVVVAAGSLGSTEILLRCRDEHGTLPGLSAHLGRHWSANANVLSPARYPAGAKIEQSIGPTISAGLEFMDGSVNGQRFFIEDDGFPNVLLNALDGLSRGSRMSPIRWALRKRLERGRSLDEKNPLGDVMVWLGEGVDAGDGRLWLGRDTLRPWERRLKLSWDAASSAAVIDTIIEMHERIAAVGGGRLDTPFFWRILRSLVTVHPLGGCRMGKSASDGVVDHLGEAFGHKRLYVADGSIIPSSIGRNPSMTIGALAERIAYHIIEDNPA